MIAPNDAARDAAAAVSEWHKHIKAHGCGDECEIQNLFWANWKEKLASFRKARGWDEF